MKKLLLFLIVLSSYFSIAQKVEWAVQNGTTGNELGTDIATNADGTSFIVGTFSVTTAFGTTTLTPTGNFDGFIAKIDLNGNYLWANKIGGIYYDEVNSVAVDNSGNAYLTGSYTSKVFFSATDSLMGAGTTDTEIFVAKYNGGGTVQWKAAFWSNSFQNESGKAIVVNTSKNIAYVAAEVWDKTKIMVRPYYLTTGGLAGGLGTIESSPITVNDIAFRSVDATNDELVIGGSFQGQFYRNGGTSSYHTSVSGTKDMYVARFYSNNTGSSLGCNSSQAGGGAGADECYGVAMRPNGDYFFTGSAVGSFTISGTNFTNSGTDCFIGKYSSTQTLQWIRQGKGPSGTTIGRTLMVDNKNYVYIGGYGTAGTFKNTAANGLSSTGLMLIKLLPTGDVASRLSIPSSSGLSTIRGISQDWQGNTYVIGNFNTAANFTVANMTSAGGSDVCFAKINTTTINTPTVNSTKCVSTKDGEPFTVNFLVSKKLNAANTFSLQIDTTGTGDFATFFNGGTLASDTSGSITAQLPGGTYSYADFRIVSSNAAYVGDQSWLYIFSKLVAKVTPTVMTRCSNDPATSFMASGSNDFGSTYSFTPSGISGSGPYSTSATSTTVYTLTTFNNNGCKDTVAFRVTVNAAPSMTLISDPIYVCPGGTVALTNTVSANVTSYTWSPGSTLSSTNAAIPVASPTVSTLYNYTLTTAQNCKYSNNVSVILYSLPVVNAGPPSVKSCLGSTIPLTGNGAASSYTWSPSTGVASVNSLTTTVTPTVTTTYTLSGTSGSNGCIAKDVIAVTIGNVTVDAGTSQTITCGNNATLTASPTGTFVAPYSYNWTPTVALTNYTTQTTVANPQTPKWYYVTLTTANGCSATDSVKVTSTEPNYGTSFSVTPSQLITLPSPAQFNNNTPSPSNYTFYWYFGDGTTLQSNNPSVFHVYQYNGNYDVTLVAVSNATGCADTLRIPGYIFCNGGTNCSATAVVTAPNGLNGCAGDSVKLMANTGAGLTYQWMQNGVNISGATAATYYALTVGNYAVAVNNGSCSAVSSTKYVSFNPSPNTPTITTTGNLNQCGGGILFLNANGGYSSYNWSTGANTQNITITQSGVYTVTVANTAGCKASASYSANTSSMPAPDICIVGMDSLSGKHQLVWNKTVSSAIDSFIIYREGIVANQFDRLAAQSYTAFSTYLDNGSNPAVQAYRYKLSLKDTCGIESLQSTFHKTIHLTINAGVGGAWNLIWNHYEGFAFGTYNIYRGTALNNVSLLTSIASGNNSYTDLTPPGGTVYYQIEVVSPGSCNPSAKTTANYSSSRSNIVNVIATSIEGYYEMSESIQIMPNPFNDELTVNIGKISSKNYTLLLTDVLGKVIINKIDNNPTQQFKLSDLSSGIYYLTIIDERNNKFTKKLIKN